jgi:hypothetical protein
MKATTIQRFDHNDTCVACREEFISDFDGCGSDCPFETGEITAPVVLRYACKLLMQHPMGIGYDISQATFAAAQALTGEDRPYPLHEASVDAVAAFLTAKHGPDCGLSGAELLYRKGLFGQVDAIALTLYAAAADLEGTEFDPEDFGDFR